MILKEWLDKFKACGIDVKGHEELFLDLEDIIKDHETLNTTVDGYKNDLSEKDKEIQSLKDKCFRLFERQTNWDSEAEKEITQPQVKEEPEEKPFSFDDMYEVTD